MEPLFLIGAGFNTDTRTEARPIYGYSIYIGEHQMECDYPLLSDLPAICYELAALPVSQSIEAMLAESLKAGDPKPIERFAEAVMRADYYLAGQLTEDGAQNCYSRFFDHFPSANFLTFNYDSLVERFLYCRQRWYPNDGYGVPVFTEQDRRSSEQPQSRCLVLHLHGTFCIYVSDHQFIDRAGSGTEWYESVDPPRFIFDPDSIASLFAPYRRTLPTFGYEPIPRRVVAPLPDKSEGLRQKFIETMYKRARELVQSARPLVSIGYAFGEPDSASYMPILDALGRSSERRLVIVDPVASEIARRVSTLVSQLRITPLDCTFREWVLGGFAIE